MAGFEKWAKNKGSAVNPGLKPVKYGFCKPAGRAAKQQKSQ